VEHITFVFTHDRRMLQRASTFCGILAADRWMPTNDIGVVPMFPPTVFPIPASVAGRKSNSDQREHVNSPGLPFAFQNEIGARWERAASFCVAWSPGRSAIVTLEDGRASRIADALMASRPIVHWGVEVPLST
jgi:hypothetical protein